MESRQSGTVDVALMPSGEFVDFVEVTKNDPSLPAVRVAPTDPELPQRGHAFPRDPTILVLQESGQAAE
jgi:hypothetical protein